MPRLIIPAAIILLSFMYSCKGDGGAKTFCDTTCHSDTFRFEGDKGFASSVTISVKDCKPDTLSWTHGEMGSSRQIALTQSIDQDIRINKSAINCVIRDTSYAWLSFNDCITGRGYLFKLPFNKAKNTSKLTGALNSFDPKFSIDPELRAYTDRGSIYVIDVNSDKTAVMTFKQAYDIDFNKIHEVIDSINVTRKRIYVKLLKEGKEVPIEKSIDL